MELFIIISLVLVALMLLLVDLFLIPGTGFPAIIAGGCIIFAVYYAFQTLGLLAGFATLALAALGCILSVVWFMHSKTLDRVALKKDIDSKVDRSAEDSVRVGDCGTTITRLALIGNADINGHVVEVKSADGFMNAKTPIVVSRITDGVIEVIHDKK